MRLNYLKLLVLLLINQFSFAVAIKDKVVAVVNDAPIMLSDVNTAVSIVRKSNINVELPSDAILAKQALEHLIDERVQLDFADKLGIKVAKHEVESSIVNIAKKQGLSLAKFKIKLADSGDSYPEFYQFIAKQLLLNKLHRQQLANKIDVTAAEVNAFSQQQQQVNIRVHLIDWLLEVENPNSVTMWRRQKQQSANLHKALLKDSKITEFATAIRTDLGWRKLSELPVLFVQEVQKMRAAGITKPIKAPNGYHVLQILEIDLGDGMTSQQAYNLLFLQKMQQKLPKWIKQLRADAVIEII